ISDEKQELQIIDSIKLNLLTKCLDRLEVSVNEQKSKLTEVLTKLKNPDTLFNSIEIEKSKGKKHTKR
ncbi:11694_t:CDS:1, partial [Racocetra persica]